jgi:hypothetical protein
VPLQKPFKDHPPRREKRLGDFRLEQNRILPDGAQKVLERCVGYRSWRLRDGGLIQQAGGPLAGHDFLERGKYPR